MKRNYLLSIKIGTVLGVLAGLAVACRALWIQRLLSCHLYYTSARVLALTLDQSVVAGILACCLPVILWNIAGGRPGKKILTSAIGLLVLAVVAIQSPGHSADSGGTDEYQLLSQSYLVRILLAVACACLGILALGCLRRRPDVGARILHGMRSQFCAAVRIALCIFYPCLILLILANTLAAVMFERTRSASNDKPNVILIMVDTLRADHLGCYGYPINTSPNIDRFARESIRFERAISQAPMTSWSVPSYMTSQYPEDLNRQNAGQLLTDRTLTLAEALKDQGYVTSGVNSNGAIAGLEHGFDFYTQYALDSGSSSPWVLSNAKSQLAGLKDRKFFLFLLFMDPHSPYDLHDQYEFSSRYRNENIKSLSTVFGEDGSRYTPEQKQLQQPYYDSEIRFTDDHVGMLLEELKRMRLYDDSLIIFLSDHGEEFGEHGYYFHGMTVYNQALSVPCIIKPPKQRRGTVVRGVFRLLDIFPTIMQTLHRNSAPMHLQGTALSLSGVQELPDRTVFSATNIDNQRSASMFRYEYITNPAKKKEALFDVLKDPGEKTDISSQEPDVLRHLRTAVQTRSAESGKLGELNDQSDDLSRMTDKQKQRLRNLGYLAK